MTAKTFVNSSQKSQPDKVDADARGAGSAAAASQGEA
jgi:hypothetical protein